LHDSGSLDKVSLLEDKFLLDQSVIARASFLEKRKTARRLRQLFEKLILPSKAQSRLELWAPGYFQIWQLLFLQLSAWAADVPTTSDENRSLGGLPPEVIQEIVSTLVSIELSRIAQANAIHGHSGGGASNGPGLAQGVDQTPRLQMVPYAPPKPAEPLPRLKPMVFNEDIRKWNPASEPCFVHTLYTLFDNSTSSTAVPLQ
jgi:hypothetical protein